MRMGVPDRQGARRNRVTERGVALIAVLWTVVLLSALATALIAVSRSDSRLLRDEISRLQAGEAAEAGIALAVIGLSEPNGGGWPVDGTERSLRFEDVDLDVSVSAESGKVDLNSADRLLIRGLLVVEGVSYGAADALADAIMDRRGPGGVHNLNSTGVGAGAGLFESVGELMQVPGVTRELYSRLAPNLTVYSSAPGVDTGAAPRDVLLAIPGNTVADAEASLKLRTSSPAGIVSAAGNSLSRIGQAFTITSIAHAADGAVARRTKVVRLTGSPFQPFWVLAIE